MSKLRLSATLALDDLRSQCASLSEDLTGHAHDHRRLAPVTEPVASGGKCLYIGQYLYVSGTGGEAHTWRDGCPTTRPSLTSPANSASITVPACDTGVNLTWTGVSNPTPMQIDGQEVALPVAHYEWQIETNEDLLQSGISTGTQATVPLDCGDHRWRVRAVGEGGINFDWSDWSSFDSWYYLGH